MEIIIIANKKGKDMNDLDIMKIIITLLGKLSLSDVIRLIGEKDALLLDKWYFLNRSKY